MTSSGFVVELLITVTGQQPDVLARVEAETPQRAAQMVRVQARPFASLQPDDAPIWQWIEGGYHQAVAELAAGRPVSVGFTTEEGKHLEWQMRPSARGEQEGSDASAPQ